MTPTDEQIRQLLTDAKTIALVGASSNPTRPAHDIMRRLLDWGYHVIPINPNEQEVLGQKAYASLRDVPEPIDIVDVFRRAEATPPIAEDAVAVGAKVLWLQSGITNEVAAARAHAAGIFYVEDACIAVLHSVLRVKKKTE